MKTALICHHDAPLNRYGLARWLASFSDLAGIVVIHDPPARLWKRLRFELGRVGPFRLLDVLAFRVYYRLFRAAEDRRWQEERLRELESRYAPVPDAVPIHHTSDPNDEATERFLRRADPDLTIARCKVLLRKGIFTVPDSGTVVFHPGICPEYRNAHGCFWALAERDLDRVGMTLLRIDEGVDTGPIYGYFSYDFDEVEESHAVIQHRVVLDNLDALRERLLEIHRDEAKPIDVSGRESAAWGHPWLTEYIKWKWRARESRHARLS